MPQLTVLMPTYNCGKYILESINSVLVQSYVDFELLIIDDGSIDNTEVIVEKIKDERIVYLKNSENRGIVETLNKGLELAKGKYIARMDADDVMLGNRLQAQVDFLDANPDYGMVAGWYSVMNESGKFLQNVTNPSNHDLLSLSLIFGNQFAHPVVTYRAEIGRKLKYDSNFPHCEDHELWIRFSEVSKVEILPFFFLSVRSHNKSTCSLNQKELKISVIKLLSRELDKIEVLHTTEELMIHAAACFGHSRFFLRTKERKDVQVKLYDKIFLSPVLNQRYGKTYLGNFRRYISARYCSLS